MGTDANLEELRVAKERLDAISKYCFGVLNHDSRSVYCLASTVIAIASGHSAPKDGPFFVCVSCKKVVDELCHGRLCLECCAKYNEEERKIYEPKPPPPVSAFASTFKKVDPTCTNSPTGFHFFDGERCKFCGKHFTETIIP